LRLPRQDPAFRTSGLADVSIADGDPNIFKTSRNESNVAKASLVMTRTAVGQALVDAAAGAGALALEEQVFDPGESLGLQRKRHRYASYAENHPGRVPAPPVAGVEVERPLADDEIIESMSSR
jgi:coenzyme F420 hydrogenase subunit beta